MRWLHGCQCPQASQGMLLDSVIPLLALLWAGGKLDQSLLLSGQRMRALTLQLQLLVQIHYRLPESADCRCPCSSILGRSGQGQSWCFHRCLFWSPSHSSTTLEFASLEKSSFGCPHESFHNHWNNIIFARDYLRWGSQCRGYWIQILAQSCVSYLRLYPLLVY